MTSPVVRVMPETGFREIVALLAEYDITGVPVVDDDGRPLGIVSEADLLLTLAAQEDQGSLMPPPGAARPGPDGTVTAAELMSGPVVCITPSTSVVAAARLMSRHGVKRLPVLDEDGRVFAMVSRGDLLRVFLREDRVIRREIVEEVLGRVEGVSPALVGVEVDQGRVVLSGTVPEPHLVPIVLNLCRSVDGVVSVTDRLSADTFGGLGPEDDSPGGADGAGSGAGSGVGAHGAGAHGAAEGPGGGTGGRGADGWAGGARNGGARWSEAPAPVR
ncbi:CBS domain-containing protein [Kitasatospora purpeofusca]|uniref:CBS domain-containing protein n=1 Tax=Kitasatospora purpeofusca TaxID=67352 RepID=UPI002A5997B8|nr:CBS domain-containing protein [Kitasatospora purpeofusca]MDY0814471.1 CBS domain-containing protein [Kitasatospora purpeofusca]